MEMTKAALGLVAAACVAAGAGGVYVATRTGQPVPTATQQQAAQAAPYPASTGGVEQSEGTVSDVPQTSSTAPEAVTTAPAPARLGPAPARRRAEATRPAEPPASVPSRPRASAAPADAPAPRVDPPSAPPAIEAPRVATVEPARPPAPPAPEYYDLVIPADAVIGLQVETPVSSDTARVEDRVTARVTRDVRVGDHVAVPAGSHAQGEVTLVERGGKLKDRARLGVRFTSIVLADGTHVPIDTEAIYREGDNPAPSSAAKIGGGAIGGAIIGGLLGGAKGAIIGSTVGGGAGTAAVVAGGRSAATLSAGSPVTVRLQQPATVTVEKQ